MVIWLNLRLPIVTFQGMDSNNERRVFDLIVRTAMDNNSQYFLFSPKLLKGLNLAAKMKVHIISNGPCLAKQWPESI